MNNSDSSGFKSMLDIVENELDLANEIQNASRNDAEDFKARAERDRLDRRIPGKDGKYYSIRDTPLGIAMRKANVVFVGEHSHMVDDSFFYIHKDFNILFMMNLVDFDNKYNVGVAHVVQSAYRKEEFNVMVYDLDGKKIWTDTIDPRTSEKMRCFSRTFKTACLKSGAYRIEPEIDT